MKFKAFAARATVTSSILLLFGVGCGSYRRRRWLWRLEALAVSDNASPGRSGCRPIR